MALSRRLYLKRTNPITGRSIITDHLVWDADIFLSSQQEEQRKLRANEKEYVVITLATEEEYRKDHWPNTAGSPR